MWFSYILLLAPAVFAQYSNPGGPGPDEHGKLSIASENINISFIPYGASVTNLFVKGRDGEFDVVLGFDDASTYEGEVHPHLGGMYCAAQLVHRCRR
jgi:aldose 1-epimerase